MIHFNFHRIKCKLVLIVLVLSFTSANAQIPSFQWVKTFGSIQQDYISDMAIDKNGFIYVLGTFSESYVIGTHPDSLHANPNDSLFPIVANEFQFHSDGNEVVNIPYVFSQVFFAKFNPDGNAVWVKNLGTRLHDFSGALVIDKIGNIIISGNCKGNINLNPPDTVNQFLASTNFAGFLGKYDSNGNLMWKTLFDFIDIPLSPGEAPYQENFLFSEMVCTSDNQLMIAGFASGNFSVVHNEIAVDTIYPGSYKGMLMKVNENGLPVFENYMKIFGPTPFGLSVAAIGINSNDEVVITGSFLDTLEIVSGNPAATLILPDYAFGSRMFFTKFSSTGTFIWAKVIEGYANSAGFDIVFDAYDNMYFTGLVGQQPSLILELPVTDFDPDTSTYEIPRFTVRSGDIAFIASYTDGGAIRWAHWLYGPDYDTGLHGDVVGLELALDCAGRLYMSGTTRCKIVDVDPASPIVPLTPGTNAFNSPPNPYILRYTTDGNYLSQRIFYSELGKAQIAEMVTDTNGELYCAGFFTNDYQFNYTNSTTTTSLNSDTAIWFPFYAQDMFLTKHATCFNRTNIYTQICAGDSVFYNGYWLKHTGVYPKFISTNGNCENVEVLNLMVTPVSVTSQTINLCSGETYSIGNQTFNQSGVYQTVFSSSNGCDSLVTTNLTIDTLNAAVVLNDNVFTALNIPQNAQLQWLNCDTDFSAIANETNSTFTASLDGNYALETSSANCRDTSNCILFSSVGLHSITSNQFKVFPIPADETLMIESEFSNSPIRILDTQGRLVFETTTNSKRMEIDVSEFQNGLYFMQLEKTSLPFTIVHNR